MIEPPKRLAIFIFDMRGGGAERATLKLAQGIAERGYAVDLVLGRAEGAYMTEISESVRVVDLKSSRALTSLLAVVSYLRRERPDTMFSVLGHVNMITLWAKRLANTPTRVVVSVRNTLSQQVQHTSSWPLRLMPILTRRFYPWADGIIAVSRGVADDLAEVTNIPRERIQVIYNPIVTPELREKARAPLDHPWFTPGEPPILLGVGRLSPQKDFPTLIQALALVRQGRPVRLLILGDGEERSSLEILVSQLSLEDDVSLPGFVQNPYPYMSHASIFILSSRFEGLPGVLIEALYCGVPLIATDCPSGPQEILADGKFGQLVPVGDVNSLAQAIETILDDNKPKPPPQSWQPFELETVVDQYIDILFGK